MNLSRIVERWAGHRPLPRDPLRGRGHQLCGARRRVEAAALRLAGLGIHGRSRRLLGYNHPDLLMILFACARLRVAGPAHFRLAAPEHAEILADADPAVSSSTPTSTARRCGRQTLPLIGSSRCRASARAVTWEGPPPVGFEPKLPARTPTRCSSSTIRHDRQAERCGAHASGPRLEHRQRDAHQDLRRDHVLTCCRCSMSAGCASDAAGAARRRDGDDPRALRPGAFLRDVARASPR